ncbi:TRAP transporter substrate-binding protein [Rhizobium sp. TRM95111]|uniref:TRAP transporter substrate-binding protein n=1 Tax=Rhizobium alarense TaxID=2846851 RepID=UPI001F201B29|nr:TRAP transporter substrate-binding protein [Rhizobium alarense]MCF3642765.1 TRAP transporter substrate-binding protein [Rhizobium alarense]
MTIKSTLIALLLSVASLVSATQAAEITLKASHNANATEPYNLGMERMSELLKEKTGGKAEIQVFPNAQLGDEMESIQGTQIGTIDIAVTANETLVNFAPNLGVFSMPFLFEDAEQMDRALNAPEVRAYVNEVLGKQGFRLIGFFSAGTRHIMTKKPVTSMQDLSGMKIRTMQNPAHLAAFKDFGANPTPLAYSELYGALETGVVDGAEAANTNYYSKKFYEVAPNWAIVGWLELVAPVIMGEARFQQLPEDVQKALTEAGTQAAAYQRKTYRESDAKLYDELIKAGVNVTKPDVAPFRAEADKIYATYVTTDEQKRLVELLKTVK